MVIAVDRRGAAVAWLSRKHPPGVDRWWGDGAVGDRGCTRVFLFADRIKGVS